MNKVTRRPGGRGLWSKTRRPGRRELMNKVTRIPGGRVVDELVLLLALKLVIIM